MEITIKYGFDLESLKTDNHFGFNHGGITKNSWSLNKKDNLQYDMFSEEEEEDRIKLSISDFTMALTCPKLFEAYYLSNRAMQTPHHSIVEAGTQFDKHAKKFLIEKKEKRDQVI